jgi:hypothetical protein
MIKRVSGWHPAHGYQFLNHYYKRIVMKTLEQMKTWNSQTLDGRDLTRLAEFIPFDKLKDFGFDVKEGVTANDWQHKEWTRENILEQLKEDVAFGFEKALDQRGISASMMYHVVQMWNSALEEGLENFDDYAQYGLPLFKATAVKYGFDNPIEEDEGNESKYAALEY